MCPYWFLCWATSISDDARCSEASWDVPPLVFLGASTAVEVEPPGRMPPSPHRYVYFWDFRLFNPNSLNFMAPIHVYKRQLSQMICWLADGLLMSKQYETGIIIWLNYIIYHLTCENEMQIYLSKFVQGYPRIPGASVGLDKLTWLHCLVCRPYDPCYNLGGCSHALRGRNRFCWTVGVSPMWNLEMTRVSPNKRWIHPQNVMQS